MRAVLKPLLSFLRGLNHFLPLEGGGRREAPGEGDLLDHPLAYYHPPLTPPLKGEEYLRGFTLIELAIVLVVIGFIVGGILVGKDLIRSSEIRATISQIERYNSATNTFRGKFNALPGDLNATTAGMFGFASRGTHPGQGDGNGIIQAWTSGGGVIGTWESSGETLMFWVDLCSAAAGNLIDGGFSAGSSTAFTGAVPGTGLSAYFPQAKLGLGNYIYVWSGGYSAINSGTGDQINYFGLSNVVDISSANYMESWANIPVAMAYNIDAKMDDGLPQSGNIMAVYVTSFAGNGGMWAGGGFTNANKGASTGAPNYAPTTAATWPSTTTCYDNGGVSGAPQQYSLGQANGSYPNCALSFKIQ